MMSSLEHKNALIAMGIFDTSNAFIALDRGVGWGGAGTFVRNGVGDYTIRVTDNTPGLMVLATPVDSAHIIAVDTASSDLTLDFDEVHILVFNDAGQAADDERFTLIAWCLPGGF